MINRKILYGYQIRDGALVIVPEEQQTIRMAFTLYIAGTSYQAVADALNHQNIPYCPEAPLWDKHKVKRLLENPRYTGKDGFPAAVDADTFQAARKKAEEKGLSGIISFNKGDCMNLPFADDTFDAVTVAYGVRNFESLDCGLKEMLRVTKPGGRLVIIELTTPQSFPMKQLFSIYSHILLPMIGKAISHDKSAYDYLPATMQAFPAL